MKKWKKLSALLITGTIGMTLLVGCGNSSGQKVDSSESKNEQIVSTEQIAGTTESTENSQETAGNWNGKTSHIVMTLITAGTDPVDMQKVQDAVNEISVKKIGVEVQFKPVSVFDAPSQVPMWIGAGEQIDLMACAFTGLSPFINMNMIQPMDQWLDKDAPHLQKMASQNIGIYDTTNSEHTYGVRTLGSFEGMGGGFMFPEEILKEAGFDYKNWDSITLDDLDKIFAAIKAKHPDMFAGILGNLPSSGAALCIDTLGESSASGVLIGTDSTKVENLFASDAYHDYLKHMRDWYEKGYIMKDAATTDVQLLDNLKNGKFWGNFTNGDYGLIEGNKTATGKEWIALMINQPHNSSFTSSAGTSWTIPVTAAEPEAAVRFLDLMMSDPDVTNLMMWGIEGNEYTVQADGTLNKLANYGNWALPGVHGNQQIMTGRSTTQKEMDEKWSDEARNNPTKGYGFCYDSSAMTNQIIAVKAVITEYQKALETGSVDLDKVYPEFLSKLKENGMDAIVADKQAQFDKWLAKK